MKAQIRAWKFCKTALKSSLQKRSNKIRLGLLIFGIIESSPVMHIYKEIKIVAVLFNMLHSLS